MANPWSAPWDDPFDATTGYPASTIWPGPVESDHSLKANEARGAIKTEGPPGPPGVSGLPEAGEDWLSEAPGDAGDYSDDAYGTSAPMAAFDSNSGAPFAGGLGPVADTHSVDTGGVERKTQVIPAQAPGFFRRVLTAGTNNRQSFATDTRGWQQTAPNDRIARDQYQGQDVNGYDPFWVPYAERPLRAHLAFEAVPGNELGYQVPAAALEDRTAMGGQGSSLYESPADPGTSNAAAEPQESVGGEWF